MFLLEWFSPISIMFHNKSFGLIINEPKILLLDDLFWTLMVHLLMTNLSYLGETTTIAREEKAKNVRIYSLYHDPHLKISGFVFNKNV